MTTTGLDFVPLTSHTGYFVGATNIGVITMPAEDQTLLWLIDTPNTLVLTKYLWERLNEMYPRLRLVAIINTHSHADHCGGNVFLQEETGCQIWATKGESVLMELPILQSALVYGGSPIKDIESKYLKADPCNVDRILAEEEYSLCEGLTVRPISLPGHYIDMAAMLIDDKADGKKVCFLADGISGRNVIKRYWIQYLFNEKLFRQSLLKIREIRFQRFNSLRAEEAHHIIVLVGNVRHVSCHCHVEDCECVVDFVGLELFNNLRFVLV
jgi:glyoxylase-like metal-dependent hydrolase (beta-lactamase superfamily II)